MGFNISQLTAYAEANADMILKESVGKARTFDFLPLIPNFVVGTQKIRQIALESILQLGGCNTAFPSNINLDELVISVEQLEFAGKVCKKDLNNTIWQIKSNPSVNTYMQELPEEEMLVEYIKQDLIKSTDSALQMESTTSSPAGLFDGIYAKLTIANGAIDGGSKTLTTTANVVTAVYDTIALIPQAVKDNSENILLMMSPSNFDKLVQGLALQNLYHYKPEGADMFGYSFKLPFASNITVVAMRGLATSNRFYATEAKNILIGTGAMSDTDEFRMWYEEKTQEIYWRNSFKLGVAIANIDEIVVTQNA